MVAQFEQNELEKLVRQRLTIRDVGNQHRTLTIFFGQDKQRSKRVFGLLREHFSLSAY